MSKKTESSLSRFGEIYLRNLHCAIRRALPALDGGQLKAFCEESRERAFQGVESYQYFKYWYVKAHNLKKYQQGSIPASVRKSAAIESLLESERSCRVTNSRLVDGFNRPWDEGIRSQLLRARRIVSEILGKFDSEQFSRSCSFSSGATTEFRREIAAIPKKWAEGAHVTEDALPYAIAWLRWSGLGDRRFVVVDSNTVFTVPKNFEKDRTCAKEPTWNMFLQKGLGNLVRMRLQLIGLLHPDAQVTHQHLARMASIDGRLTTDDLKAASDSVSLALCELLLPPEWFRVFYALRSHKGTLPDGSQITYEKISSMGNGYTFELETLLFYALARAACGKDGTVSVYGDDLIYPSSCVEEVRKLLAFVGFETNADKSFSSGPFRESCGGHYFKGHDVTPFYLDKLPTTWSEIIELHNNIIAYHSNMPPCERWLRVARECRKLIPRSFWGPMGLSGVIWSEWDEARPYYVKRYQAFYVKAVTRVVPKQRHEYYLGSLYQQLWGPGQQQPAPLRLKHKSVGWLRRELRELAQAERLSLDNIEQSFVSVPTPAEKASKRYVGSARWSERLPVAIPRG